MHFRELLTILRTKPDQLFKHKPPDLPVPKEMLPIWAALALPFWMPALQGVLAVTTHELVRNIPDHYLGLISIGLFLGLNGLDMCLEKAVLSTSKYSSGPVTTAAFWLGTREWPAVILNHAVGIASAVANPADIASVLAGDRWLYSNLIARGLVTIGTFGLVNVAISQGYTHFIGVKVGQVLAKIKKPRQP